MPLDHFYQEIHGWFDFQEIYRQAIDRAADGDILVEIGSWKGKSLAFLLVEAAASGKQLRIVGVDHFEGSVDEPALLHEAATSDLQAICRANLERAGYPFELLKEASPAAAARFADHSVAFIFVDGSHDLQSVALDLQAWLPKLKPEGVIAGHDYGYPGVRSAVGAILPGASEVGSSWRWQWTQDAVLPEVIIQPAAGAEPAQPAPKETNETTPAAQRRGHRRLPRNAGRETPAAP